MAKTYIPSAVDVVTQANRYLSRWQGRMTATATTEQIAALVELLACIAVFLQKWHKPTPIN